MKVWTRLLLGSALLLFGIGMGTLGVLFILNDKKAVEHSAQEELYYRIQLTATRLDALFRIASLELKIVDNDEKSLRESIGETALRLPHARNIYLIDENGRVLQTAYNRNHPSLALDPEVLQRLQQGSSKEYRILTAPEEQSGNGERRVLALFQPITKTPPLSSIAVVIFTSSSIQGELGVLKPKYLRSFVITDQRGNHLYIGDTEQGEAPPNGSNTVQTMGTRLATVPLSLSITADHGLILDDWLRRSRMVGVLLLLMFLAIGILLTLGIRIWKKDQATLQLQQQIDQKNTLFREVNHRIRNNLHIVQTVLSFGYDRVREFPESAPQTLETAIDRVQAIELLHELLYTQAPTSHRDFGLYLRELSRTIQEAYGNQERITVNLFHDSNLDFSLEQMVPLALITSELLTNAFKYAFPDGRKGTIEIRAEHDLDGGFILSVADDGVGLPEGTESGPAKKGGIGTLLVENLASQLKGTIEKKSQSPSGLQWTLRIIGEAKQSSNGPSRSPPPPR